MIKLLIFDWGDVCGTYDAAGFESFLKDEGCDITGLKRFFHEWKPRFDRGKITESRFWGALKDEVGFAGQWQTLAANSRKNHVPDLRLLEFIKMLRSRFSTALLSNMDPTSVRQIQREIHLEDYFDKVYFSCELGEGKLEKGIVRRILSEFKVAADQVVFVDDFAGNIEKGKSLGFHCIQYRSFEDFKRQLGRLINFQSPSR